MRPFPPFHELSQRRVLVVGDVMLDRYWFGEVNRISPEAPVPVVLVEKPKNVPAVRLTWRGAWLLWAPSVNCSR